MGPLCLREAGCDRFGLAAVFAAVNLFHGIDHRQDKPGPESASQKGQRASPPAHPLFRRPLSQRLDLLLPQLGMAVLNCRQPAIDPRDLRIGLDF